MIEDQTKATRVTERLRADIINKVFEPGSRITIKEISERYGTSNMPVREAFRTLEGEKLLEINAYKGATVQQINQHFVRDMYGLLRALEGLIYETALPEITENVLAELRDINAQIWEIALGDFDANHASYLDLNTKFHDTIMAHGKNEKALELYNYYHMLARSLRKSYRPQQRRVKNAAIEHDALIEALKSKNLFALRTAVDAHVNHALEDFLLLYGQNNP